MATITPKEIKSKIRSKILEGKSHQAVFDELNTLIPNREIDLARMVCRFVTLAQREKYNLWNRLLMVLLGIVAIGGVILSLVQSDGEWDFKVIFMLLTGLGYFVTIFLIYRWDMSAYLVIDFFAFLSLFEIGSNSVGFVLDPSRAVSFGLVALATYIYTQVGGKYQSKAVQYTDGKGQIRARHTVTFKK